MKFYLALHIIFVITWFAGTFYLPRLFVYHAMSEDQISRDRFTLMEKKLFWFTTISVVLASLMGFMLTSFNSSYYFKSGWFHIKLTLVFLLWGYHVYCYRLIKQFEENTCKHSHVWFRVFNEIPVLPLFIIVFLVVYQPII
ncbi:MAG: CopD family protein [Gammaproteobacteria bacterium]|nr:CopD family protein [Gammaproteobacteria bacterium]